MRGTYRFYKKGELVGVAHNVITNEGAKAILRYLSGQAYSWADAIAVGVGDSAVAKTNTRLAYEIGRGTINFRSPDFIDNSVVFKATLGTQIAGTIMEVGAWSSATNTTAMYPSRNLFSFDNTLESVTGGAASATNSREGVGGILSTPTSTTDVIAYSDLVLDLAGYDNDDTFSLAYYLGNTNVTGLEVRLITSTGNYYSSSFVPAGPAGYKVQNFTKSAFAATGTPDWAGITAAEFRVTGNASGASVLLDAFAVNDETLYANYVLVSRATLGTPIPKTVGEEVDIEYSIEFTTNG